MRTRFTWRQFSKLTGSAALQASQLGAQRNAVA
jgi:hypothetical protein